ncbi:MAG: virulence factor SrfC family protein, partial [Ferrovibrionaceae bacterium]
MMTNDKLVQAVRRLGQGASEARGWVKAVQATAPSVANQSQALINATRQAENLSRKLAGAADRRVCVGVFGPSQAGKSYLVSALARRPGESLTCNFAGDRKDFLRDINPPGDRESTGLVTRFTTTPSAADQAFPVELRLLSETDLVKILANAYFSDFDANNQTLVPPDAAAIRGVIAAAEAAAGTPVAHL